MPRSCPTLSKDQRIISVVLVHSMGTCVCNSKEQQKGTLLTALLERDWRCKKWIFPEALHYITVFFFPEKYIPYLHHNCKSKNILKNLCSLLFRLLEAGLNGLRGHRGHNRE